MAVLEKNKTDSYLFVVNSSTLTAKYKAVIKKLHTALAIKNIRHRIQYTTKQHRATEITRAGVLEKYSVVVACGGDGTVREVINGMYPGKTILGVLPLGTANDFAKELGLANMDNALRALTAEKKTVKDIAIGWAEFVRDGKKYSEYFCSTSGIGFDAHLLKKNSMVFFKLLKKIFKGYSYPLWGFAEIFFYRGSPVVIFCKSRKIKTRLFMMNANFVKSMGGIKATSNAHPQQKVFDIFLIEESHHLKKMSGMVWYALTSKKIPFKEVHHISKRAVTCNRFNLSDVSSFSIISKRPIPVQLHGDYLGETPATFQIIPHAIKVLY